MTTATDPRLEQLIEEARERLDAYVRESGVEPANLEWFHCLIRYKEAAATSLIVKRMIKARGEAGWSGWEVSIPALTIECIERLQRFTPVR